jgi:hypothetical protein
MPSIMLTRPSVEFQKVVAKERRKMHMNFIQKAILRACWQEEAYGKHAPRPWLRWLLSRVIGMRVIPPRESERTQASRQQWLALRKAEARKIDPETAEVVWEHGSVRDPYGVYDLTYEEDNIGRNYFACSPGRDVWVSFHDLPQATRDRLWVRVEAGDLKREETIPF